MMVLLIYVSVLLTLYFIPLSITSPCIMERGSLKAAPAIIGYQGAPMVSCQIVNIVLWTSCLP